MKFDNVGCSQCGRDFGPGDHGFSHCDQHPGHVQDMAEWQRRLRQIASEIAAQADAMDARYDDPRLIAGALRPAAAGLREVLADMRLPPSRRARR